MDHEKKHVDIVERALSDTNRRWVGRFFEACATTDERAKELVGKEFLETVSADVDALQERIDREFMELDNSETLEDFDCSCRPKPPKGWEGQISGISGGERWSALVSLRLTREDDPVYEYELAKGKIRYLLDSSDSSTGCEYEGDSGEVQIPPSRGSGFLHLFALEKLWIYDGGGQFAYEYMVHVKCPNYEDDEPHRAPFRWWFTGPTTQSPTVDAPAMQLWS
jgi:hypothetical protein